MRKYIEVFRLSFKMQITWRFDVAMTMVSTIFRIVAAWILWRVIFESNDIVNGFTFSAMLSYYIISSILASIDFSNQISGEVSELIRVGRFSGHMVTPMNPMGFFGSMIAGESAFHLVFSIIAALICALTFNINIVLTTDIACIVLSLAITLLGLSFMACYQYFIGILTFKFMDISFFLHIQGAIIAFVTGSLVPLSLLPKTALMIFQFLPFTHVVYTPTQLLTGQMSVAEGFLGLVVIAAWSLVMLIMAQRTYGSLRVKYDGVGI